MDKHLHVISFDIPWPVNYGGVIDVFYKRSHYHSKELLQDRYLFETPLDPFLPFFLLKMQETTTISRRRGLKGHFVPYS